MAFWWQIHPLGAICQHMPPLSRHFHGKETCSFSESIAGQCFTKENATMPAFLANITYFLPYCAAKAMLLQGNTYRFTKQKHSFYLVI
ncbi:MAG: hypothetical protein KBT39_06480 [Bacteroidales bacterium]|nr:hypothetical protein [Bacteroidales bacterium]